MHYTKIKELRLEIEKNYFVEAVAEDFILVSDLDSEHETKYRVYGNRCEWCGRLLLEPSADSLHLFELNGLSAICSNPSCGFTEEMTGDSYDLDTYYQILNTELNLSDDELLDF